ncbi:TetR/AcrR family transcriptional regulator [Methylobacterium oryzihabitans]|uniref:TetR/AcrR family transcriptional regulator n=1 Tax=Methylobacterium oryzihabitans TaxID=2499852 RepID=A0A437NRL4_9HYPH|nr:TetR family transcriptional regulator [Methylobacterium oryzihabitans]RVU12600.1 TetR/AcrR family transcriptional regulator [Methylobacterium oryzihabitans]
MRITKQQKQANRERIVAAASRLFRERGFDGVGVADLMASAGLTHGGFYNHFRSKDALIAEACAQGFGEVAARYAGRDAITAIEGYLSRAHRDARGQGCPLAALSGDAAREPDGARTAFASGIEDLVRLLAVGMPSAPDDDPGDRAAAFAVLAQAVGAVILSRACPDTSRLADEILDACRTGCRAMIEAGAAGRPAVKRR